MLPFVYFEYLPSVRVNSKSVKWMFKKDILMDDNGRRPLAHPTPQKENVNP